MYENRSRTQNCDQETKKFTKNISYMIHPFLFHIIAMCRLSITINTTN